MKKVLFSTIVAAGLAAAACDTSNPGQPSVSFTAPVAGGPSSGSSYKFKAQPVTVSITNSVRTATGGDAVYTLEVALDAAFANRIFTQENVTEGAGGSTSVTLPALSASSGDVTYYWRWRPTVDGLDGPQSDTRSFVVQQQIIVNAPTLNEPETDLVTVDERPTFVTNNATRQGAVGTITYVFQISQTADFATLVASQTLAEQAGGSTSWRPDGPLPEGTLYWRVQARDDSNEETSGFTSPRSLVVEPFNPKNAIFHYNFLDIADWAETATITSVLFTRSGMLVDFDRRTGPNRWPEVTSPNGFGPLQYTLGLCYKIDGQWHCSAPIQFWDGRDLAESGPWDDIPNNWFYDAVRWGPMAGYRPQRGELVMVWAGQGNLRGLDGGTQVQRTNFAPVRWGEEYIPR
jgi:hypothetical protein